MDELSTIVDQAKNGGLEAFEQIVVRFQDMAVGYAYSILHDYHAAQDAAQEAFSRAYLSLAKLQDPAAFCSWFRRIVFTSCTRMLRKKGAEVSAIDGLEGSTQFEQEPSYQHEQRWMQEQIQRAIATLPEQQQAVFVLYHIHELTYHQISSFLGLPETTVTNRLHSARTKLRRELLLMVENNIGSLRVSSNEHFTKKVIAGIQKIGFEPQPNRGPENIPLPSVMHVCLRALGEDYGVTPYAGMALDNTYIHFMGVTGAAFRFFWNWNSRLGTGGRTEAVYLPVDGAKPYISAFDAAGYECELLWSSKMGKKSEGSVPVHDKETLKRQIVESIDKGRPVIGIGVVGPTEHCVITGYDEAGEVLIGWSYFQEENEDGSESSGYFRKRHWYPETLGVVIIGDKRLKKSQREVYIHAIEWGSEIMAMPMVGGIATGLAAFKEWANALLRHDEYTTLDSASLQKRLLAHEVSILELAERRWYGARFLEQAMACLPSAAEELKAAVACLDAVHGMAFSRLLALTGDHHQPYAIMKLADVTVRMEMADLIHEMGVREEEAIKHLGRAREKANQN